MHNATEQGHANLPRRRINKTFEPRKTFHNIAIPQSESERFSISVATTSIFLSVSSCRVMKTRMTMINRYSGNETSCLIVCLAQDNFGRDWPHGIWLTL